MPTYKVVLAASVAEAQSVAAILSEALDPPPAVSVSHDGAIRQLEAYFEDSPDIALLRALIADHHGGSLAEGLDLIEIPDENWVARSQRGLHPVRAGRFLIHGSHDRAAGRGKRFAIEVEAGQAFGTAHHGTTRGCLLAIDRLAKTKRWTNVLDVGTGSGVLAIAAAKVSNACVLASDIDPIAVAIARQNARLNGVSGPFRALTAAGVDRPMIRDRAPFDLVMANILAGPLIALAPRLTRLVASGGHIVLSGLLNSQAREVSATYLRLGLAMDARLELEGWTTLVLKRPDLR